MKEAPPTKPLSGVAIAGLFDLEAVKQDSPRMKVIKAHDIQTHHAPHCEDPWMAVPMKAARKVADDYDPEEPHDTIPDITASIGILLEDLGMIFYGQTQREAEDAAIQWVCRSNARCGGTEK